MALKTHQLSYRIKDRLLISNICLHFNPGTLYGILGPNGSGKTTLLKNFSGIWIPTEGHVEWEKQPLFNLSRTEISRILSLVPQAPAIPFDFTVADIVAMGRYVHGDAAVNGTIIEHSLYQADIWHLRDRPLSQLSGGERQRTYIARAFATEAPVMLLDEPIAHLDLRHQLEIWSLLRNLAKQNRVVIVTVHDLLAAQRYCDEIALLSQGQCIAHGKYSEVMTPELMKEIFGVCVNKGVESVKTYALI